MKIALIGDVHANLHALEAVLAHATGESVEAIWNVGDYVGYGAYPDEVVQRLVGVETYGIIGNYDRKVLRFKKKRKKWRRTKRPEKWLAFEWAHAHLSKESRAYLQALPREMRLEVDSLRILLTHGSPVSEEEPLTPDTAEERLAHLAHRSAADVVICGHSHRGFARRVGEVWFINPGSVGRPDDGDRRAAYAVLDLEPLSLAVQHHRVGYDVAGAVAAIRQRALPEVFAQMLVLGRDFDTALDSLS